MSGTSISTHLPSEIIPGNRSKSITSTPLKVSPPTLYIVPKQFPSNSSPNPLSEPLPFQPTSTTSHIYSNPHQNYLHTPFEFVAFHSTTYPTQQHSLSTPINPPNPFQPLLTPLTTS